MPIQKTNRIAVITGGTRGIGRSLAEKQLHTGWNVAVASRDMTNMAHHEENNEIILQELTRITRKRLVIIETILEDNSPEQRERTFVTDALWNRFLFCANIPVPGTYELVDGSISRFKKYGWEVIHSEHLGYDIPSVQVLHHLLVFDALDHSCHVYSSE